MTALSLRLKREGRGEESSSDLRCLYALEGKLHEGGYVSCVVGPSADRAGSVIDAPRARERETKKIKRQTR